MQQQRGTEPIVGSKASLPVIGEAKERSRDHVPERLAHLVFAFKGSGGWSESASQPWNARFSTPSLLSGSGRSPCRLLEACPPGGECEGARMNWRAVMGGKSLTCRGGRERLKIEQMRPWDPPRKKGMPGHRAGKHKTSSTSNERSRLSHWFEPNRISPRGACGGRLGPRANHDSDLRDVP